MRFLKILMKFIFLIHFFKSSLNSKIFRREMRVFHTNWSAKITLQLREIRIIYFLRIIGRTIDLRIVFPLHEIIFVTYPNPKYS